MHGGVGVQAHLRQLHVGGLPDPLPHLLLHVGHFAAPPRCSEAKKRPKVQCGGNRSTPIRPVSIGLRPLIGGLAASILLLIVHHLDSS